MSRGFFSRLLDIFTCEEKSARPADEAPGRSVT